MKIGIVNTGGDVQSLNAVISTATKYALNQGHEMIGFKYGWEGILDNDYITLNKENIRGISHVGGTILKTTNKGRFAGKAGAHGEGAAIPADILALAKANLAAIGIDALIEIGGDGGISAAMQLEAVGVKIIGLPKSIDNDLEGVDSTFGFSTTVEAVNEALVRVHTTATSHERVVFVETMGRHAGWIALYAGLAGGASIILIPEIQFSYSSVLATLRERKTRGRTSTIVVVAEGAKAHDEELIAKNIGKPEVQLGGISNHIIDRIEKLAPGEFEMRATILGHVQRGGNPNAEDSIIAKIYGTAAIDAIETGKFGYMLSIRDQQMTYVKFADAVGRLKLVTDKSLAFQAAKKIGISFGQ